MDGSRNIHGNRSSLGFLLLSMIFIALAVLIVSSPIASDDSDAGEVYIIGDYQYEVLSSASNEVKISAYNKELEDVVINEGVYIEGIYYQIKEIADYGFMNMDSLKTVEIKETTTKTKEGTETTNGLEVIGVGAFYGCKNLNSVTLPKCLTKLLDYSFMGCESLVSIWIRLNVSTIGEQVFFGCSKLKDISVDVQNEHYMAADGVLYDKDKIRLLIYPLGKTNETYNMPNTVTSMDKYAMYGAKFKNVVMSNALVTISESALEGSAITAVMIPGNVSIIGDRALCNCNSLKAITVNRDNDHFVAIDGVLFNSSHTELIAYPSGLENDTYSIPDEVKSIKQYSFLNNTHLKEVYLTDNVNTIGKYAFSGCTLLQRVEIPDSVTTVSEYAYSDCISLRSFILSKGMTVINVGLLSNCISLEVLYITPNITVLNDDAFLGCTKMNSLYIPSTVIQVNNAFKGFTFYASNQINVIEGLDIVGYTYTGKMTKMCQEIGTYSLIHYDEDGGSVMVDDEMTKHNDTYIFPSYSGVRDGYNFAGWLYQDSVYKPGDTAVTPYANTIITALWEKIVEVNNTKQITLEFFLAFVITVAGVLAAIAVGRYAFRYHRKHQLLKEDDDRLWEN